jgi:hypothetical protein
MKDDASKVARNAEKEIDGSLDGMAQSAEGTGESFAAMGNAVVAGLATAGAALAGIAAKSVQVAGAFEVYEARLTSIFGSAGVGQEALQWAKDFANTTPFQVDQVVDATAKLSAYGITAKDTLGTIGDTAAAMGKDLDQAVEAFADALTGEFERLKEFGIKAKTEGEEIIFTYKNASGEMVRVATENSQDMIEQTLLGIWNEKYEGAMGEFMTTWAGVWSQAGDAVTNTFLAIGESGVLDLAKESVEAFTVELNKLRENDDILQAVTDLTDALKDFVGVAEIAGNTISGLAAAWNEFAPVFEVLEKINPITGYIKLQNAAIKRWIDFTKKQKKELTALTAPLEINLKNMKQWVATGEEWSEAWSDIPDDIEGINEEYKALNKTMDALSKQAQSTIDDAEELEKTNDELSGSIGGMGLTAGAAAGDVDFLSAAVESLRKEAEKTKGPIKEFVVEVHAMSLQMADDMGVAFSDALFAGMTGRNDDILAAFDDLTTKMKSNFADAIGVSVADGSVNAKGGIADWWSNLTDQAETSPGQTALTGAFQVYSAYQKRDIAGGAIGGAQTGLALSGGNPWGAVIGAVVGAAIAYFGSGDEKPETTARIGAEGGFIDTKGHQRFTDEMDRSWIQGQVAVFRQEKGEWMNALRELGDASLFDLLGEMPIFDSEGWLGMSANNLATFIRETWLPNAFQDAFSTAISAGLTDKGVTFEAQEELFRELDLLPNEARMQALTDFLGAVAGWTDLWEDMDFDAMLMEIGENTMQTFARNMGDVTSQIDMVTAAWDHMSLTERAHEWEQIEGLVRNAREAEMQLLRQIQQLTEDITRSFNAQIEALELGGMSESEKQAFAQERIDELMGQLAIAGSPEEVARISQDIQRYAGILADAFGEILFVDLPSGESPAEMIQDMLREARDLAISINEGFEQEIRDANQELIDRLTEAAHWLGIFTDALEGATETGSRSRNRGDLPGDGNAPDARIQEESIEFDQLSQLMSIHESVAQSAESSNQQQNTLQNLLASSIAQQQLMMELIAATRESGGTVMIPSAGRRTDYPIG